MTTPKVTVSIVHWNGGEATLACIASVFAENYPGLSVVVVDNASTDDVMSVIATRWPTVQRVRNKTNTGFTGGHNRGIAVALADGADYVLLLNQDARLVTGCIERIVALAQSDDRNGLVSPLVRYVDDPDRLQFCGSWLSPTTMSIEYDGDLNVIRSRDRDAATTMCLWGTALLIRRAVIEQIGVLDDRMFAYFEDTDYSLRASAAGWRNRMCFDAAILHEAHPTRYTRSAPHFYYMARNQALCWRKASPTRHALRIRRVCTARTLMEAAKLKDAHMHTEAEACINGLWDSLLGRFGPYLPERKAPRWLRSLLLWHPYFLSSILGTGFPIH